MGLRRIVHNAEYQDRKPLGPSEDGNGVISGGTREFKTEFREYTACTTV